MRLHRILSNSASAVIFGALALAATVPAHAGTQGINWTDWTNVINPAIGYNALNPTYAEGTMNGIYVGYTGQTQGLSNSVWFNDPTKMQNSGLYPGSAVLPATVDSPTWNPSTSWIGTALTNAPPTNFNSVAMVGGVNSTETISFCNGKCDVFNPTTGLYNNSVSVTDPVMAFWSLGSTCPGGVSSGTCTLNPAEFIFSPSEPFSIIAGGPSAQYGGVSITQSSNTVLGAEGSGTIEFVGTFDEISFTTPDYEDYYAFTVGDPTPEPETLSLFGLGLLALPFLRSSLARRRRA